MKATIVMLNNELEQPPKKKPMEPADKIDIPEDKAEFRQEHVGYFVNVMEKEDIEKNEDCSSEKENTDTVEGMNDIKVEEGEASDKLNEGGTFNITNNINGKVEVKREVEMFYMAEGNAEKKSHVGENVGTDTDNHGIEMGDKEEQMKGIEKEENIETLVKTNVDKNNAKVIREFVCTNVNTGEAAVLNTDDKERTEKSEQICIKDEEGSEEKVKEKETVNTKKQGPRKFADANGSEKRLKEEKGNGGEKGKKQKSMKVDRKKKMVGKDEENLEMPMVRRKD